MRNIHSCKSLVSMVNTQFNAKVKCIRLDNRNEFMLKDFYKGMHSLYIMFHVLALGTPRQNSIVERIHHHIPGVPKALVFSTLGRKTSFDLF